MRPINGIAQVGHTGGGPSAASTFARLTGRDLTVVILTNTAQPFAIQELVGEIASIYARR